MYVTIPEKAILYVVLANSERDRKAFAEIERWMQSQGWLD